MHHALHVLDAPEHYCNLDCNYFANIFNFLQNDHFIFH